jgi:hypothetical protein
VINPMEAKVARDFRFKYSMTMVVPASSSQRSA